MHWPDSALIRNCEEKDHPIVNGTKDGDDLVRNSKIIQVGPR